MAKPDVSHRLLRRGESNDELAQALRSCRAGLGNVALFTAVINLLMLAPALYMLQVYDRVLSSGNQMTLLMLSMLVLGVFALMGLLEWVRSQLVIRLGTQAEARLSPRVFDVAHKTALAGQQGEAAQMLVDLTSLRQFVTGQALFAFFDAPWFPGYLLVMFLLSPWLGLMAVFGALLLIVLAWGNELLTREPFGEAGRLSVLAGQQAGSNLRNAEVIEAMGMLSAVRQRWKRVHHGFIVQQNLGGERAAALSAVSRNVRLALQSLVLGFGAWLAIQQLITPGMMIAGSILMARVLAPIDQLISVWRQWSTARVAYTRLRERLQAHPPSVAGMPLPTPTGELAVKALVAAQPGCNKPCLSNLSFDLPAGASLAIVGPSGSGKSTLARLLVGAQLPASGEVRLDGADLRLYNKQALGAHIGYLPQDVQLLAGSVSENIARLGTVDAEEVVTAARLAGVHDMILGLPAGYDTVLSEGGGGLSGGQRQRIGLARALYGLPAIIVLDEPDANLDEAGEQALRDAIGKVRERQRTLIVITYKPALLARLDHLLILNAGCLQAFGATTQLLQEFQRPTATTPSCLPNSHFSGLSVNYDWPRS